MRIENAEVIVTSPDRNFVTLQITTDDGVTGLGDATLNGRELAVASYLRDHVVPLLIGRDAHAHRGHLAVPLPRRRTGGAARSPWRPIAAVDVALWDIKAKAAGHAAVPAARRRQPAPGSLAYGHASGRDLPELFDSDPATTWTQGYRAIRVQTGVPGLDAVYGVAAPAAPSASGTTTSPPRAHARCRSRRTGTPAPTCATCPASSRRSATSSAPSCRCCTTGTTG